MTRSRAAPLAAGLVAAAWLGGGAAHAGTAALERGVRVLSVPPYAFEAEVPSGYALEVLSTALESPRLLTFDADGTLFAGSRSGAVYRIPPPYRRPEVLVRLDDYPHSVAFRDGEILVARTGGLFAAPWRTGQARLDAGDLRLLAPIPGGRGHNSRTVRVGPDARVYVSLGIRGNCSDEYLDTSYPVERRRGGVYVLEDTGAGPRLVPWASGLRNPVGLDWHPVTGVAYASNNGPDHWGFDLPPESFARLAPGSFHGMPWFQWDGTRLRRDACVGSEPPRPAADVPPPAATFPARNAPMGVAFVPRGAMDPRLEGDAVVALRGSWGTPPTGGPEGDAAARRPPKLVVVRFEDGEARRVDDLVTGFQLADGRRWARPVGVAVGPDGALYFTSDEGLNALFRLRREAR